MDRFWQWLMQANARAVYGCSVVALVLCTGWWTWKEYAPNSDDLQLTQSVQQKQPHPPLGLLAFLRRQMELGVHVPANLFMITRVVKTPPPSFKIPPKPVPPTPPPPPTPPVPPPPPRDIVNLTLVGYMKGTDGQEVAIIANSKTRTTSRVRQGDPVCGMTVARISMDSVELLDKGNKSITIHTSKSQPFEDGRHVE